MKAISYITVSTQSTMADADKQSRAIVAKLDEGYEIISAVGDGNAVHYVLTKDITPPIKPAKPSPKPGDNL